MTVRELRRVRPPALELAGRARVFLVLATGGTGVALGWVYWRHGLLVAMVTHMIVDCLGAALAPVLVPLVHHLG